MHGTRDEVVPLPPPFEVVLRGFDRQQVTDHFNVLKAQLASTGAERDAAVRRAAQLHEQLEQQRLDAAETSRQLDRLRRDAAAATTELERLQRSPLAAATGRIQRMLQMAEDEAAELRAVAERETTLLRESARAEAEQLLAETSQRCERLEVESTSRRQTLETDSAARRQRAEQQSDVWIRDYQTSSVAALHLIMYLAGERLSSRVVKVTRQVTAARALRSEVTGQLTEVHRMLVDALGVVEQPTAAELAEQSEDTEQSEPSELEADRWLPEDHPTARFGLHP